MNKKRIILASSSPRRRAILEKMGFKFEIITSDYDEFLENDIFTYEKIENLAYNKAKAVFNTIDLTTETEYPLIISADTVVVLDKKILGKPHDKDDAIKMLKELSGEKHFVVTSICVINTQTNEKNIVSETSFVEFEHLSNELIKFYVEKYKPLDKAGSYGIQELPEGFIKEVSGSFENIIGLCPIATNKALSVFNL